MDDRPERVSVGAVLLGAMLFVAFAFGGASRADSLSQIPVRLGAILIGAIALMVLNRQSLRRVRPPLLLLGGFAGILLVQLIPLPPALWTMLPGREIFAQTATVARIDQPWHTISLIPEATVNALLATLPGFAALFAIAATRVRDLGWLVALLALCALISGVVGLIQISSGKMYFYAYTNHDSAVGMFANRNHQAALLSLALPTLAAAAALLPGKLSASGRYIGAGLLAVFVVPLIVVTGSRAGLVLMLIGAAGALLIMRSAAPLLRVESPRRSGGRGLRGLSALGLSSRMWTGLVSGALAIVIVTVVGLSRATAVQRLFAQDIESDARIRLFRPMIDMASDYFPFGAGFGTFASIFKVIEPDWRLGPSYFNHAHNDLLEVIIEGGVASILLLALGFAWWCRATWWLWRLPVRSPIDLIGRLGTIQTLILALASISDYPLRTPLCQVVFVVGCAGMAIARWRTTRPDPAFGNSAENVDVAQRIG